MNTEYRFMRELDANECFELRSGPDGQRKEIMPLRDIMKAARDADVEQLTILSVGWGPLHAYFSGDKRLQEQDIRGWQRVYVFPETPKGMRLN